jgi:hypothetical protein
LIDQQRIFDYFVAISQQQGNVRGVDMSLQAIMTSVKLKKSPFWFKALSNTCLLL